jgi:aspartate carbamoyltransferase catalytic subunit
MMTATPPEALELGRDLLGLRGMDTGTLRGLLQSTGRMLAHSSSPSKPLELLAGRSVALVFLENSTRTRGSFTLAGQRLGAGVVDFSNANSTAKGETLADTARTVAAMGADAIVVRSARSGTAACAAQAVGVPVINAGDGRHEHPTQGLLDTYTLCEALECTDRWDLSGKRVAIVGDVINSRVARSSTAAMTALGAAVEFVGPEQLVPDKLRVLGASIERDLDAVLERADAVMMLRVQQERGAGRRCGVSGSLRLELRASEAA